MAVSQSTIGRRACAILISAALLGRGSESFAPSPRAVSTLPCHRTSSNEQGRFDGRPSPNLPSPPAGTATELFVLSEPQSELASIDREMGPQPLTPRPVRPAHPRRRTRNGRKGRIEDDSFLRKRTEQLLGATEAPRDGEEVDSDLEMQKFRGDVKVDRRTFNWLLDAWAFSGADEAPSRSRSLLDRMEQLDDPKLRPDVRSYTKYVHAISRVGGRNAGRDAHAELIRMENMASSGENPAARPNTFTYTAVAEAYANSGGGVEAARKAEEVVNLMEQMRAGGSEEVFPTARAYNAVISAWAKAGVPGSAQRTEDCLVRMERLYAEGGNDDVKPNVYNFNGVINAWANSGEGGNAARHAQGILQWMERLSTEQDDQAIRPTTSSYNAAIDAWAKSGEEDAAERAEELLMRMEENKATQARPNTRSFNAVLNAWAKSRRPDAAQRAESILKSMERRWEGGDSIGPDATSFSTAINAWGRSQSFDKADRALALYLRMKDLYQTGGRDAARLRPNVVVCNSVMNACAFSVGTPAEQSRAVEIAHMMLKELETQDRSGAQGRPDQVTYGTFLKVCANQMELGETRDRVTEVIFRKCVRDGQVGEMVLRELEGLVSGQEMWERLVGENRGDIVRPRDLPKSWTCNVVEGKWARRRKLG